jgi:uncharacterized protein with ParB-like and HNH nuclease domain
MANEVTKVAYDIFKRTPRFFIPPYQRSYSWGIEQLNQLLGDMRGNGVRP